ncbi:MAG TPA: response regulator [Bryobacteraceae bacterium]|nr:response regulator [Bryobacteraceae bacterium]
MERADLEQWKAREVARLLALVETERRYYQDIIAALPVGLLVLSKDLSILSANRAVKRIFGLRSGESLRGRLDSLLPSWLLDRVQRVLNTGTAETGIQLVTDSTEQRHLQIAIQAIHDWDDSPGQEALLTIEDVTEITAGRPQPVQPAIEQHPVAMHEPAPAPVAAVPVEVAAPEVQHAIEPTIEHREDQAPEVVHEALASVEEPPPAVHEEPVVAHVEEPAPAPAPEPAPKEETLAPSAMFENLRAAIWALDLDSNKLLFANQEARQLLGDEPWQHIHPDDRVATLKLYHAAIENPSAHGETVTCEYRALSAGTPVWIRETSRILTGEDGHSRYLVGVSLDATERHLLEQQAVQAGRVDAVTRLSSRLAHDLNNMLMIVNGYAEELTHSIPQASPLQADVREILTGTGRIATLTHQLLDYTRLKAADPATIDLHQQLTQIETKLQAIAGSSQLELHLHPERMGAKAETGELEEVIEALLRRAREVSGENGVISIATEECTIQQTLPRPGSSLRPGKYAVVSITDEGKPLDEETRATLFESFLVSPSLAKAYAIVRQWGGDVVIAESTQAGTTVDLYLPLTALPPAPKVEMPQLHAPEPVAAEPEPPVPPVEATPPPAPVAAPVPPPETVLLVEDESGIRALVRKILRRQGYEVLEAESGEQALDLSRQYSGKIDLIITDLMLPKIGGRELVAELQKEGHQMKVLYVSGYTDDPAVYAEQLPPGTAYLQKPFTLGSLLDKVKDVLGVEHNS